VRAGLMVVRLKGGDPFVFGRGGEEALGAGARKSYRSRSCRVSRRALAVPAYAGIPVTHRNLSTAFAVVAGTRRPTKPGSQTDWSALAHVPTLIILMGTRRTGVICAALIAAGRDPQTARRRNQLGHDRPPARPAALSGSLQRAGRRRSGARRHLLAVGRAPADCGGGRLAGRGQPRSAPRRSRRCAACPSG